MRATYILALMLPLAACGGAKTSPLSASGYAQAGDTVTGGTAFSLPGAVRITGPSGERVFTAQDVDVAIANDGSSVTIDIDGESYTLNSSTPGRYSLYDGDLEAIYARRIAISPVVDAAELFIYDGDSTELNSAYVVIGFDTDPDTIAAFSNTATFTGDMEVVLRNNNDDAFGDGSVLMVADFDDDTVSGSFSLSDAGGSISEFEVPTTTFVMQEASISGNAFAGDVTLATGDIEGALESASYSGNFFGAEGESAGGYVNATVSSPDFDHDTLIEGVFVLNKDDE